MLATVTVIGGVVALSATAASIVVSVFITLRNRKIDESSKN